MAGRVEQRATTRESYLPSLFTRHHAETHKRAIMGYLSFPPFAPSWFLGGEPRQFPSEAGLRFLRETCHGRGDSR